MIRPLAPLAALALVLSAGAATAQQGTPPRHDAAPVPHASQPSTPDRPPAASMPQTNAPSPETTGQAPAASEKMEPGMKAEPGMESVGGSRSAPGEEKK